jgi:hypothetical protein
MCRFIFQKEISHSWEFPSPARIVLKLKGFPGQLVFWVGTFLFFIVEIKLSIFVCRSVNTLVYIILFICAVS